jgi:hypothetical protein
MSLYYCLAKTVVNGKIEIQGISVTYSATADAFDSSNQSFKDAATIATINSNAAAILAARKTIDLIVAQYLYVLSDENITSMINNSLKTSINRIFPRLLKRIATTDDGINYILKKNTTITPGQYLLIPNGIVFTVPGYLIFINNGIIQIGDNTNDTFNTNTNRADTSKLSATPTVCIGATFNVPVSSSNFNNNKTVNVGTGQKYGCLNIYRDPNSSFDSFSSTDNPSYNNTGTINNYAGGQISVSGVNLENDQTSTSSGTVNNIGGLLFTSQPSS